MRDGMKNISLLFLKLDKERVNKYKKWRLSIIHLK